jgi:hypothetical protein
MSLNVIIVDPIKDEEKISLLERLGIGVAYFPFPDGVLKRFNRRECNAVIVDPVGPGHAVFNGEGSLLQFMEGVRAYDPSLPLIVATRIPYIELDRAGVKPETHYTQYWHKPYRVWTQLLPLLKKP